MININSVLLLQFTSALYFLGIFVYSYTVCSQVELYRMVRQLYQKTRGAQDVTVLHPDFIGDRLSFT